MIGSHAVILNNQAFDKRKKRRGREGVINGCRGLGAVLVLLLSRDCPFADGGVVENHKAHVVRSFEQHVASRVCDVFADTSVSIKVTHDQNMTMYTKLGDLLLQAVPGLCVLARIATVTEVALGHKNWLVAGELETSPNAIGGCKDDAMRDSSVN